MINDKGSIASGKTLFFFFDRVMSGDSLHQPRPNGVHAVALATGFARDYVNRDACSLGGCVYFQQGIICIQQ